MAKLNKQTFPGLLFGISGTLGNMVYSSWKGKPCVRSRPKKSDKPRSPAQEAQQLKFGLVNQCLQPALQLITLGFQSSCRQMTALNKAVSLALKQAVSGEFPDYQIDYSKLLLSQGALLSASAVVAEAIGSELIRFNWMDNSFGYPERGKNKAVLIGLSAAPNVCIYSVGDTTRKNGFGLLHAEGMAGKKVHVYISFLSADEKKVSDSVYAGEVLVSK